jgi:hypothetical protein
MKDVYVKFSESQITVEKDENYHPKGDNIYTDRKSIVNALELIRDSFKSKEILFYESHEAYILENVVDYHVGDFFFICVDQKRHTFFINEDRVISRNTVPDSARDVIDIAIEKILS